MLLLRQTVSAHAARQAEATARGRFPTGYAVPRQVRAQRKAHRLLLKTAPLRQA